MKIKKKFAFSLDVSVVQPLGMESGAIANSMITASKIKAGHEAWKGRLNGNSCWMPPENTGNEYIIVNFTSTKTIFAIATQGAPDDSCWVKSYDFQWYFRKNNTLTPKVKPI